MRHVIPAALAAGLLMAGLAQAQTTGNNPSTGTAANTTLNTTNGNTAASAPTTTGTTAGALGTAATGAPNGSSNAAVNTSSAQPPNAPVPGANSFTEGEARARIRDKGFGDVTNLKLDNQGIWRGTATKDGKNTNVALDYQGNVVAQ